MKSILICPSARAGMEALNQMRSLSTIPLLGCSLAGHWLEFLSQAGARKVTVLTAGRVSELRAEIGDGARWGLEAEIISTSRELSVEEARSRYQTGSPLEWLTAPNDVIVGDFTPHFLGYPLFTSYATFFAGLEQAFFRLANRGRIGAREIAPKVWAGMRTHIGPGVTFEGPCWLGEDVHVERDAHLGPFSILEDRAWVGAGAEVSQSIVGPETNLGVATSLRHSLAYADTLIDWRSGSTVKVTDSFLMCGLRAAPFRQRLSRILNRVTDFANESTHAMASEKALAI